MQNIIDTDPKTNNTQSRELFIHDNSNELLTDPVLNIEESEDKDEEEEPASTDEE